MYRRLGDRGAQGQGGAAYLAGRAGRCYIQSMIDWSACPAVERDPAKVSGAWVFRGTRVPIASLFENLEDDVSVPEYLSLFQGVSRQQVRAVLEHAVRSTLTHA